MIQSMGLTGLISIMLSIVFIFLSWWALQVFKFDLFFSKPDSPQGKMLLIILSILFGHGLANFFMDYLGWSMMLKHLF